MKTTNSSKTLKKRVEQKISDLQKISKNLFKVSPKVTVTYNLDSVNSIGRASLPKKEIQLNENLLEEFGDKYIDEVVSHEYAHIVVDEREKLGHYWNSNVKPHGKEFKSVCRVFGCSGKASISMFNDSGYLISKEKQRNKRLFKCGCACRTPKLLSIIRHNKV